MGLLTTILRNMSGALPEKVSKQLLYDKVISFKGLANGVGTSTIVQSVASNIARKSNYSVCIIDTNYIYPTMYPMLVTGVDDTRKDLLDFKDDLTDIIIETNLKNVHLISMYNRTVIDMLSSKDNPDTMNALISAVKSYYDVVLIDLSNEPSMISTYGALKSNKIFLIGDQSMRTIYNLRKVLNTLSTLGIPTVKSKNVVLNKVVRDVNANTNKVIIEAGLDMVGEIYASDKIATRGITGGVVYDEKTVDEDIKVFNEVIDNITDLILVKTERNKDYTDKQKVDEENKKFFGSIMKKFKKTSKEELDLEVEPHSDYEEEVKKSKKESSQPQQSVQTSNLQQSSAEQNLFAIQNDFEEAVNKIKDTIQTDTTDTTNTNLNYSSHDSNHSSSSYSSHSYSSSNDSSSSSDSGSSSSD